MATNLPLLLILRSIADRKTSTLDRYEQRRPQLEAIPPGPSHPLKFTRRVRETSGNRKRSDLRGLTILKLTMYNRIHYKPKIIPMHRTQIYLQDDLHGSVKARARTIGVSMSELIRRTLETSIEKNPVSDARAFFERLTPLKSFAQTTPEAYVAAIRSTSRLLRTRAKP